MLDSDLNKPYIWTRAYIYTFTIKQFEHSSNTYLIELVTAMFLAVSWLYFKRERDYFVETQTEVFTNEKISGLKFPP